jgi:hypothetical protein
MLEYPGTTNKHPYLNFHCLSMYDVTQKQTTNLAVIAIEDGLEELIGAPDGV